MRCLQSIFFTSPLFAYIDIVSTSLTERGEEGCALGLDLFAGDTICLTTSLQQNLFGDIASYFRAIARIS